MAKQGPPPVRPLTINPLRPSGPIRRTCGVIKLPVTWVPPPCEDELKLFALVKVQEASMDVDQPLPPPPLNPVIPAPPVALPAAPPAATNGGQLAQDPLKPVEQPQPPQLQPRPPALSQPQAQSPVLPLPTSVVMVPALWENRLRGVMAYDFETGNEIKISPEKLQNGLNHSSNSGETKDGHLSMAKSTLSALLNKQLAAKIEDKKHLTSSLSTGNVVPSLLAHGKNVPRQQQQQGVLSNMVPSLKTIKENGSLIAMPQQNSLGGNIVLTLPTMASANAYKPATAKPGSIVIGAPAQPRIIRANLMPGSGRTVMANKPGPSSVSQGSLYVSESELRRQEEKVQLIRKQLLAAQSSV